MNTRPECDTFLPLLSGNPKHASKASFYQEKYEARCKAIHDLMWNEECGCWFDLDISIEGYIKNYF